MALLDFLYKFFNKPSKSNDYSWTQVDIDNMNAEGPYEKHSPECVCTKLPKPDVLGSYEVQEIVKDCDVHNYQAFIAKANAKLNQALSPPKTTVWSKEDLAKMVSDWVKKTVKKGGEIGYDPTQDPKIQKILNSPPKRVRKADYTDALGFGHTWSSKSPTAWQYNQWLNNFRDWKALEMDSKYGKEYKHVHDIMRNSVHAYESVPRLPVIVARITQLKRMLRGATRIQNLTTKKLSLLTQELARLKALAYHQQLALQWINSGFPICVFMEKRTGNANAFLTTQVACAAAKLYL